MSDNKAKNKIQSVINQNYPLNIKCLLLYDSYNNYVVLKIYLKYII